MNNQTEDGTHQSTNTQDPQSQGSQIPSGTQTPSSLSFGLNTQTLFKRDDTDNNTTDSNAADQRSRFSGDIENEARPLLSDNFAAIYASTDDTHEQTQGSETETEAETETETGTGTHTQGGGRGRSGTQESYESYDSLQSKYSESISDKIVKFSKKRFWWFCGLGVVAIIILNLSFLPRTSLSRDYRRWNNLHLTKTDVKRNFLVYSGEKSLEQYGNSAQIDWLLQNFTSLNSKNPVNLLAQDNVELTKFVHEKFVDYGFKTSLHNYDVNLSKPLGSSLTLYDSLGAKVYSANLFEPKFKTPSYYGFGTTGEFKGEYVFVNTGLEADYDLLAANNVDVRNKTVIIKSVLECDISIGEKVSIAEKKGAKALVHYTDFSEKTTPNKKIDSGLSNAINRDTAIEGFFGLNNFKKATIPVLPVSFAAIQPILGTLNSNRLKGWDFAPVGDGFELQITTKFDDKKPRRLTNIMGRIDGIIKDGDIVIGASRDSFDSSNPMSSHVVLLEIMRHFSKLVKLGWKPLRNIRFVSFDGSRNGQLGAQLYLEDAAIKKYTLAFINIDDDAVRGSEFKVDANPMLNHIITKVSKSIPFPKDSKAFKSLPKLQKGKNKENTKENKQKEILDDDSDDEDDDKNTSLYRYWKRQSNNTIGNDLGRSVYKTDGFPFQYHATAPIMNVKFDNDPKRDSSVYVGNSNYYSYKWLVSREIDDEFTLHGVLIRYLGLFLITLSEHEVVDFKTHFYFHHIHQRVEELLDDNEEVLDSWADKDITKYLDIPFFKFNGDEDEIVTFGNLTHKFLDVTHSLKESSIVFDSYNANVQRGLIQDYPWYQLYKKVKLWAQFKVSNYKLLHLDRDLSRKPDTGTATDWFNHVVYNNPLYGKSMFGDLQHAIDSENLEKTVKVMFELYEKLKALDRKMS